MQPGELDASGRRRPVPADLPPFSLPADCVITAVSQTPSLEGLEELDHDGDWLVTDADGIIRYVELSRRIADRPDPRRLLQEIRKALRS